MTVIKMETKTKIVKVYSNNSKKSRLKRNKNKFQRIWDEEKQTYIKVRKAKYPVRTTKVRKDWRDIDNAKALKRRQTTQKPKSVPVPAATQKPEKKVVKPTVHKKVDAPVKKAPTINMFGKVLTFSKEKMMYLEAA